MMKLTTSALIILTWAGPSSAALFRPQRISYESLLQGGDAAMESSFVQALTETGIVSITGIPGMSAYTHHALSNLDACLDQSQGTQDFTFADGTRRRTLATHSIPDGGMQMIHYKTATTTSGSTPVEDCQSFDRASDALRSTVAQVTEAFADRITEYFGLADTHHEDQDTENALLTTANSKVLFKTFSDVVEKGEHLEHYHSYTKGVERQDNGGSDHHETIELHVDQGLFIAFTPGRIMMMMKKEHHHQEDSSTAPDAQLTSGFYVKTQQGDIEEVEFTQQDDLVFMLGDGVNQYINNKIVSTKKLRATPHTLRMDAQGSASSRVWYGRMVLPPVNAVHPAALDGATFGEIRQRMIAASHVGRQEEDQTNMGLGCSGGMVARDLQETTCENDSIYCWHRCMNTTEYGVSEEICQDRNLQLHCINPRLEIWARELHGDYYPACADATVQGTETPFPTLPDYPRSEDICSDAAFDTFADAIGYDFVEDIPVGARFMWSIVDGEVHGRIAYNGLFGWLAFGFAGPPGSLKNGMHGANVLMALGGGNYSAFSGLDLDMDPFIAEYEIHPTETPFRIWGAPLSASDADDGSGVVEAGETDAYTTESTECFTAMSFKASSIGKRSFNLQGKDELVWAANGENAYVQYHGPESRRRFAIDWPTGKLTVSGASHDDHDDHGHDHDDGSSALSASMTLSVATMALLLAFFNL